MFWAKAWTWPSADAGPSLSGRAPCCYLEEGQLIWRPDCVSWELEPGLHFPEETGHLLAVGQHLGHGWGHWGIPQLQLDLWGHLGDLGFAGLQAPAPSYWAWRDDLGAGEPEVLKVDAGVDHQGALVLLVPVKNTLAWWRPWARTTLMIWPVWAKNSGPGTSETTRIFWFSS